MSTVFEYLGLKYKVHAKDHLPPHFHVEGNGGHMRIRLGTFEVLTSEGFTHSDINRILGMARRYEKELQEKWEEYHGKKDRLWND